MKQCGLLDLVFVGLNDVVLNLLGLLLALQLSDLLTLQVVLHLSLDELALKHLLLQIFDEVKFEFVELVRDGLRIFHLLIVLLFKLLAHTQVVLLHLLLLELFPMLVDLSVDCLFAAFQGLLSLLLVHNIAE